MNNIFQMGFPMSYIFLELGVIGILLCIGAMMGIAVFLTICFMISMGMIRVTPLFEKCISFLHFLFPETIKNLTENIKHSFLVKGDCIKERGIYMFHPHGAFSSSYFFHSLTDLTEWPKEKLWKTTISRYLFWLPFVEEISSKMNVVANTHYAMKKVLEEGESLHIIPGGTSEIPLTEPGKLIVKLSDRKGIFRLALETGTPLIPVLSYGENEVYNLAFSSLQKKLQKYHFVLPIPSFKSIQTWIQLFNEPLESPITTHIGTPIQVQKKESVTYEDIQTLRTEYIEHIKQLYKQTKPETYAEEIIIV